MEVLDDIRPLGVRIVVVAFAEPRALRGYRERLGLDDVLLLSDQRRETYGAFGFGRASVARVWLHPAVWLRYARLIIAGRRPEPVREDSLQLGGDVLADRDGTVRWVFRGSGPEDRPTVDEIAAAVRDLR